MENRSKTKTKAKKKVKGINLIYIQTNNSGNNLIQAFRNNVIHYRLHRYVQHKGEGVNYRRANNGAIINNYVV